MRSMLFVPGDDARKLDKAPASGADALIFDLEDAVAPSRKAEARRATRARLEGPRPQGQSWWVRINALATGLAEADLDAVLPGRPDGIVLPKCEGPQSVAALACALDAGEVRHGLAAGSLPIVAIATETARGVLKLAEFAGPRLARLAGLMWGAEDLAADVGGALRTLEGGFTSLGALARDSCLLAAAAQGVPAFDTVYVRLQDQDGLVREAQAAARAGFDGKAAIHPAQLAPIHDAFTPGAAEIAWAEAVIAALAAAGGGLAVHDGQMLDAPHRRRAERILARIPKSGSRFCEKMRD